MTLMISTPLILFCIFFLNKLLPLRRKKIVSVLAIRNDNVFEFLIFCRYFNLKKSEDNFTANVKFTSNMKIMNRVWENTLIFPLNFA